MPGSYIFFLAEKLQSSHVREIIFFPSVVFILQSKPLFLCFLLDGFGRFLNIYVNRVVAFPRVKFSNFGKPANFVYFHLNEEFASLLLLI